MTLRCAFVFIALLPALTRAAAPDCNSSSQVALDKISARIIVVGEVHGTEQAPAFIGQLTCGLLKQGRPVIVALERDGSEQQALNRYLDSQGQRADVQALLGERAWTQPMQDGRSSKAMLQLIEQLRLWRQAGQRLGVLAMQSSHHKIAPQEATQQQRLPDTDLERLSAINDRSMADNVWMASIMHPGYTVIALAGNVHTAVASDQRSHFMPTPSFADVLASYVPIHVIGLKSRGGSSWNLTSEGPGVRPSIAAPMFMVDARIDSQVDLGEITASPPASSN